MVAPNKHKFLFLDIDGVLNNKPALDKMLICEFHSRLGREQQFQRHEFNFVDECMDNLKLINDRVPNLEVVISSNWRFGGATPEHFIRLFSLWGISLNVVGMIEQYPEDDKHYPRSFMIGKYISEFTRRNPHDPVRYVCVDDRHDLYHNEAKRHTIFTNPQFGLTLSDAVQIINRLNFNMGD